MTDACAGAHHLNVASLGTALIAQTILMGNRTLADIGDDFHVRMRMGGKAGSRRDFIVVPDPQGAEIHALRIIIVGE